MPVRSLPPDRTPVPASNGPSRELAPGDDLYTVAQREAVPAGARRDGEKEEGDPLGSKMLRLVQAAETSAERYSNFTRKTWDQSYRAYHNKHITDSKYNSKDYASRSKLFRPKTRGATRKVMATTAAALFSTIDAVAISAGNEADPSSRAGAALVQEVLNYRLDRTSRRNAIPWFPVAMGQVQTATLTGVCISVQSWKLETKKVGEQPLFEADPVTGEQYEVLEEDGQGALRPVMEPILKPVVDRPDCIGVPPENVIIDSGADWTDPAQSSAFLGIKWPMKLQDIRKKEHDPQDPWKPLPESVLKTGGNDSSRGKTQSIRSAREGGTDPHAQANQADEFRTIWVTQWFVRTEDDDYTFWAVGSQHLLTEPKPVEQVHPWNGGERNVVFGYGAIEAHKIFPMSPAQAWAPLQAEMNDLANLTIDGLKLSIAPVAKVKRGRQVELDKLRVRSPGTSILMQDPATDVVFEKPPGVDAGAWQQMERLNNDFDTLAGQFDQGSVMSSRSLNETVGGMKLLSGAANIVMEFDQRVFFETWAEPTLAQIVRLCQYYEHDETILALCGERAKLWQEFGVSEITDQLLDAQVTTRIDVGVGAGDPQQRLNKFGMAAAVVAPLLKDHPKFATGEFEIDVEAVFDETFGAVGYRDGGKRFLKKNPPPQGPDPMAAAEIDETQASAEQKRSAAHLNEAKAKTEIARFIADVLGQGMDRQERAGERDDARRDKAIERDDTQRARQEDREDAKEARDAEHSLKRDVVGAKQAKKDGKAPPKQPAEPEAEGAPTQPPRSQEFQLIRGPDGLIAGARVNGRTVKFHRGPDGRIAGGTVIDGAKSPTPSPIELPPAFIQEGRGPSAPPGLPFPPQV